MGVCVMKGTRDLSRIIYVSKSMKYNNSMTKACIAQTKACRWNGNDFKAQNAPDRKESNQFTKLQLMSKRCSV